MTGLTALQALVDHADVQPSERVLVLGGAGGVGALTVQLGHLLGADVTATVRSDVADLVRQHGATRVIDTRSETFDEMQDRYDVVIDTVGRDDLGASRFGSAPAAGGSSRCRRRRPRNSANTQRSSSSCRTTINSFGWPVWSIAVVSTSRSPTFFRSSRGGRRSRAAGPPTGGPARPC